MSLPKQFEERLAAAGEVLKGVSEMEAGESVTPSGWTRRHVLGHLLDSCINNHVRFVRASLNASFEGPSYDQKGWVSTHGYAQMSWQTLVDFWISHNQLLLAAVRGIQEEKYLVPCRIGDHDVVTLEFLMLDYLDHTEHHIRQIGGGGGVRS